MVRSRSFGSGTAAPGGATCQSSSKTTFGWERLPSEICCGVDSRSMATCLRMSGTCEVEPSDDETAASVSTTTTPSLHAFQIRQCEYAELGQVAEIIMEAFYQDENAMWKALYKIAELDRLQQNFAYADQSDVHQMLVAQVSMDGDYKKIAGFVDIDLRPLPKDFKFPQPRPYLSDLCIAKAYRRQGMAKALVEGCEQFCIRQNQQELFIRVQETNRAALQMYQQQLEYEIIDKIPDETTKKARDKNQMICTLRKEL